VPVAVNCCVAPNEIVAVGGVIAIDTSEAAVIVSSVDPLIEPEAAEIVAVPVATLVAKPIVAPVVLIVAVVGVSDDHVAVLVRICVLPSV
jgi:hypothetical protein